MGATTIIKHNYEINYVNINSKGRQNRQCNLVLIIKVMRSKERAETEAEVDTGQISLFGAFSQSSHRSRGNPPSPPTRRKSPQRNSSNRGHRVNDDDDDDDNDEEQFPDEDNEDADEGGRGRRGGGYGGDGGGGGKRKRGDTNSSIVT
jgi:hypothetical protein